MKWKLNWVNRHLQSRRIHKETWGSPWKDFRKDCKDFEILSSDYVVTELDFLKGFHKEHFDAVEWLILNNFALAVVLWRLIIPEAQLVSHPASAAQLHNEPDVPFHVWALYSPFWENLCKGSRSPELPRKKISIKPSETVLE